ncbi:NACHT domain-containing protein [Microvirga sp. STR05]|uniref:NACHT domain-containing protein n=1 Tax=Hymenobacter duratus TaxID=2771356 RepID=A0ABR8JNC7_9BACT|nr:NACHT domain-containing protein [Hymenobacter duratus]MBD2716279.1 NACHT domain-containing protein [Hymenobacter duratus]MBR7951195.1 NACHT domain-containing protein [Microvirga sp. STR05]
MLDYILSDLLNVRSIVNSFVDKRELQSQLEKYVQEQYVRNKSIKNSLFRNEPVEFYRSYVPLTIQNKSLGIMSDSLLSVLKKFNQIIIIGNAGSGKTTLLRHLVLECIKENDSIPVSVNLRSYNALENTFENYVSKLVSEQYYKEVKLMFGHRKFTFVMDGFDEIRYDNDELFIGQIQDFINKYNQEKFVITSRPGTNVQSLDGFYVFNIKELNENDVYYYLNMMVDSGLDGLKISNALTNNRRLVETINTPLLISLFALFINNNNEIPDKKSVYFRAILDSLLSKHDSVSKLGYIRERLSGLSKDEIESVSTVLAFRAFSFSKYQYSKDELYHEFQIIKKIRGFDFDNEKLLYDLIVAVNILNEDGLYYSFQHVLLMEYLAALFVSRTGEMKPKFYEKLVDNNGVDISVSILEFFYELDRFSFVKYYYVPMLELIVSGQRNENYSNFLAIKTFAVSHFIGDNYDNEYFNKFMASSLINSLKSEYENNFTNDFDELFGL